METYSGSQCESLIGGIDFTSTLVELAGGEPAIASAPFSLSFAPQLIGNSEPKNWRKTMLIEAGNSKATITKDCK